MSSRSLREARKRVLDAAIRAAAARAARLRPRVVAAFDHLLQTVFTQTSILSPRCVHTARSRRVIDALAAMAAHRRSWKRPLADWTAPASPSQHVVLESLASHLFARFPIPRFMAAAWVGTAREQHWYIGLGAGESVRALDFPVRLNRRMAHAFRSAPDDLSILAALRWAQVRGHGGSPELARLVASTRLGRELGDETLFAHVVAFLAAQPSVDPTVVGPFVDYFYGRGRAWPPRASVAEDFALCALGPRTRTRILQECGGPPPARRTKGFSWKPAPFRGLVWFSDDPTDTLPRTWRIDELCSSEALRQEGLAMRHCVATYATKCALGRSSIWSMTFEVDGVRRHAVTIEVDVERRTVCQVKGHANARPKDRFLEVLHRWAAEQGLLLNGAVQRISTPARA